MHRDELLLNYGPFRSQNEGNLQHRSLFNAVEWYSNIPRALFRAQTAHMACYRAWDKQPEKASIADCKI